MFRRNAYLDRLKNDLEELIEALEFSDLQKHSLRSRWLDQVLHMEVRANNAKALYYASRLTTIGGGVLIPALVQANLSGKTTIRTWTAFGVSLLVAISAAVEGFMRYGEQWRHYRLNAELLKSEGWLFFQLGGRRYRDFGSHAKAYPSFAQRVEKRNRLEVEEYLTEVEQDEGREDVSE